MKKHIWPALKLTLLTIVFFAAVYPLVLWSIAQLSSGSGKGETVTTDGGRTFYSNIAQAFTDDGYFWPRPSAVGYNAAGSGGSNKGPSNEEYLAEVAARIDTFLMRNPGVERSQVPVEMVTASGSGLDPHISPQAALVQIKRVAAARGLSEARVTEIVESHTEKPLLGFLGPSKINVLKLNIALDGISGEK